MTAGKVDSANARLVVAEVDGTLVTPDKSLFAKLAMSCFKKYVHQA